MPDTLTTSAKPAAALDRALTFLAAGLLGLHLISAHRISFEDLRVGMLGAVALIAISLARPNRTTSHLRLSSIAPGAALLGFGLWRISGQPGALAAGLAPLPLGLGLALLIGGWKGLTQFWREGLVVAGLVVSPFVETLVLELAGVDLAPSTAQFTAFLLRLGGQDASARDVVVNLPDAWIVVSQGCSGLKTMYFLIGFSVVLLLLYPLPGTARKSVAVLGAGVIGYFVNSIRVAILALMAAPGHEAAFQFWHVKQGAMVFEVIAVAVFLGMIYLLMPTRPAVIKTEASHP